MDITTITALSFKTVGCNEWFERSKIKEWDQSVYEYLSYIHLIGSSGNSFNDCLDR